jgi:integrase
VQGSRLPRRRRQDTANRQIVRRCLPFHDLRHAYTTWLVDDGVPVNMAQRVMLTIDSDHSHEDQFRTFD